jgi:hypothetical protein
VSGAAIARVALFVTALAAVVVIAGFERSEDRCTDSVKSMFVALRDAAAATRLDATIDDVETDCDGSARLVDSAGVLFQEGHADRAAMLLREAVDREPESFSAWAGLAAVLAREDPAAAADAAARAKQLNRYYRPLS